MNFPASELGATGREPSSNPAWQQFWSTGTVDTFGSPVDAVLAPLSDQSPPLFSHWRAWMGSLPDAGELLDVATGNGVVLSHLLMSRSEAAWHGVGVELAEPNLHWLTAVDASQRDRIAVRGQVQAESLPFDSGRFAVVTSQFGIEYADLSRAAPEAVRVLQPGGSLGWTVHHAQGRPARLAHEELAHLTWLEQAAWFDTIVRAIHVLGADAGHPDDKSVDQNLQLRETRSELDRLGQALRARAEASFCPDLLRDIGKLTVHCLGLANRREASRAHTQLATFQRAMLENRSRLEDLIAHALDESSWAALLSQLRTLGISIQADTGPLFDRGHLMGWWLHGQRD